MTESYNRRFFNIKAVIDMNGVLPCIRVVTDLTRVNRQLYKGIEFFPCTQDITEFMYMNGVFYLLLKI